MSRRFRALMILFVSAGGVAALAPSPALADPPAGASGRHLTLDEALRLAEETSPLVRRARAEREVVAARDVGASVWFPSNPVIGGGAGPRREGPPSSVITEKGVQYFAHAEQTVEIGGQRSARRAVVSRALRTAELRVAVARAETRARVRATYVGTQLALARVDAAAQREALVAKLLDAVSARVAGGASSNVDLELARLERGSAARARVDATLAAADALARLRLLVGLRPRRSWNWTRRRQCRRCGRRRCRRCSRARRRSGPSWRRWRRASTRSTPTSRAYGARRSPARRCSRSCSAISPVSCSSGAASRYRSRCGGASRASWRWRAPIARALQEERTLVERDVALEVERAFQAEVAQREMTQLLDREVLPAADAAVTLMTEGWRAGKFDLFRLLQTSRDASEARRLYLETLGLLWESSIALDRAVGAP